MPATAHGFPNKFFLGHLWDVLFWMRGSRRADSFRQVARHGGLRVSVALESHGDTCGPEKKLLFCAPLWPESCRFFAEYF